MSELPFMRYQKNVKKDVESADDHIFSSTFSAETICNIHF